MKLTYETGTATLIQFIALGFLNLINTLVSATGSCLKHQDCITNVTVTIILYLLLVGWFGFIWMLGYMAQARRSKRLALLLICAEVIIAFLAFYNIKHHSGVIGIITSVVDLILSLWIISLAFRLMRASTRRMTVRPRQGHHRPRQRIRS